MDYILHAFGILCIINVFGGVVAGDKISEKGRRARPISIVASLIYVAWLFLV